MACAIIQVSGGGLVSGIAVALKARMSGVKVIGVSMERGAMFESQKAGKPVLVPELATLADSLGGGIGLNNTYTFQMIETSLMSLFWFQKEISNAIRHAYWSEKQIIEGSGSVGIAALISGKVKPLGPTMILLSGCNIDINLHHRIISGEDVDVTLED